MYRNLSSFGLIGLLPNFSSMDALVTIDLHDNSLTGSIPEFLGSFPNLKKLDLSHNRFNGTVPPSLSGKNLSLVGEVSGTQASCSSRC
ncbi:probable LRR receptor-like serine/threonine-protein kinase At5g10290 [Rosa rugosa]|uniref:probable LRR receptor-like serine/threonine-protein kinase At5g10290 n=1 Tax=Rosa rugosa TaxID=74645 RepID=UPI002B40BB64|nr:probable LRR receptor-like serine/threonine-protein kinase At5g10290 [Rosa rugosa]